MDLYSGAPYKMDLYSGAPYKMDLYSGASFKMYVYSGPPYKMYLFSGAPYKMYLYSGAPYLYALRADGEAEDGSASLRVLFHPHHGARVDLEVSADVSAADEVVGAKFLDAFQLPVGQLDDGALHEVGGVVRVGRVGQWRLGGVQGG